MLVGRRRVGKTALLLQSFKSTGFLYLFVVKTTEKELVKQFFLQIKEQLNIKIFGKPETLNDLFEILIDYSETNPLTVVIDEFQDKVGGDAFALFGRPNGLDHSRLGLTVTRKVGSAVRRNRVKRVLRQIYRTNRGRLQAPLDIVVNVRPTIVDLPIS